MEIFQQDISDHIARLIKESCTQWGNQQICDNLTHKLWKSSDQSYLLHLGALGSPAGAAIEATL